MIKLFSKVTVIQLTYVKNSSHELVNPSNAEATCVQITRRQNIFENHLNPAMLVFIG